MQKMGDGFSSGVLDRRPYLDCNPVQVVSFDNFSDLGRQLLKNGKIRANEFWLVDRKSDSKEKQKISSGVNVMMTKEKEDLELEDFEVDHFKSFFQ